MAINAVPITVRLVVLYKGRKISGVYQWLIIVNAILLINRNLLRLVYDEMDGAATLSAAYLRCARLRV